MRNWKVLVLSSPYQITVYDYISCLSVVDVMMGFAGTAYHMMAFLYENVPHRDHTSSVQVSRNDQPGTDVIGALPLRQDCP